MLDSVIWWVGLVACMVGALCGIALLLWLAGNAWMDASRKWRAIFRAEINIMDYIQHRKEFERWKTEQEALRDGKGD